MHKTKSRHRKTHAYDHSQNYLVGFAKCAGLVVVLCGIALLLLGDPIMTVSYWR